MIRITGGKLKGRRIETPAGDEVRPLPDMVRLALGNTLAAWWPGAKVLEVFAGTGSFSIEAMSRGAASAVLVELDRSVAALAKRNIESVVLGASAKVVVADAFALKRYANPGDLFDMIFLGPPFPMFTDGRTAAQIADLAANLLQNHIAPEGIIAIQTPAYSAFSLTCPSITKEKIYGKNKIVLFQKPE